MKRNITVNIFGSLYPMDEDAYAMLNAYIANMRDYFSRQQDGKEIADDIEGRVAELMTELRQQGVEAISIDHIEEIINRVGNPEQMIDEESESAEADIPPVPAPTPKKKLFRDPDHKVLGGVFAGLGCYFGINPLWLRLIFISIIFCSLLDMPNSLSILLLTTCAYLVCLFSIPMATNPAERLQMKGEHVNLSNMCEEFLASTREMISRNTKLSNVTPVAGGLIMMMKGACFVLGIMLLIACIAGFSLLIISMIGILSYPWSSMSGTMREDFLPMIQIIESNPTWLLCSAVISILVFLFTSLYITAHFTLKLLGRVRPLSSSLKIVSLVLWIASILVCTASCSKIAGNTAAYVIYIQKQRNSEYEKANAIEKQLELLERSGWKVTKSFNVRNFTNIGEHFSGNKKVSYLDAALDDKDKNMEYEVVREMKVAPGIYTLEAKARANGDGAEIFYINGAGTKRSMPIPACGNKGGSVWINAKQLLEADTAHILANRDYLNKVSKVNNSHGFGWENIKIENIKVGPDSIICYGVSNISDTHTWDGTWLSATSFELKKVE